MKNEILMRQRGGVNPKVRYCLINNINADYREPLEVHTDSQGQYILVPEPPVNTPEELLHREFIGYFGIQGLYDETQKKITLARLMPNPSQSGSKYYLTEQINNAQNMILEPIGLIAVYGLKSPLLYYFSVPNMPTNGVYYADYLGHSGYSFTFRDMYTAAYNCNITYDESKGVVCDVPETMSAWVERYYESAGRVDPELSNRGTDIIPLYLFDGVYSLRIYYNPGNNYTPSVSVENVSSDLSNTFSLAMLESMRLQITVTSRETSSGRILYYKSISGIEVNGVLYSIDTSTFQLPDTTTQIFIYNYNTEYVVYGDLTVWPFE